MKTDDAAEPAPTPGSTPDKHRFELRFLLGGLGRSVKRGAKAGVVFNNPIYTAARDKIIKPLEQASDQLYEDAQLRQRTMAEPIDAHDVPEDRLRSYLRNAQVAWICAALVLTIGMISLARCSMLGYGVVGYLSSAAIAGLAAVRLLSTARDIVGLANREVLSFSDFLSRVDQLWYPFNTPPYHLGRWVLPAAWLSILLLPVLV